MRPDWEWLDRFLDWLIATEETIKYQLQLLPYRPRIWWDTLWIRKDEFHKSLDMDGVAVSKMNKEDQQKYLKDLVRRREIAHQRDLDRN